MRHERRIHTAEFKALKGVKTINQIAQEEGVLAVQVSTWKKELHGRLPALFESGAQRRHDDEKAERDRARLERKVGQLIIENEFLEKKSEQLGIHLSERP